MRARSTPYPGDRPAPPESETASLCRRMIAFWGLVKMFGLPRPTSNYYANDVPTVLVRLDHFEAYVLRLAVPGASCTVTVDEDRRLFVSCPGDPDAACGPVEVRANDAAPWLEPFAPREVPLAEVRALQSPPAVAL